MQYQEFIKGVQKKGNIPSLEQTETVVEASLATLGERMSSTNADKLRSQLPNQLKKYLTERVSNNHFSLEEYYNRVGARAKIGHPHAVQWSRAVMYMLNKTITSGLRTEVLASFPPDFAELFGQEPTTPFSPSVTE